MWRALPTRRLARSAEHATRRATNAWKLRYLPPAGRGTGGSNVVPGNDSLLTDRWHERCKSGCIMRAVTLCLVFLAVSVFSVAAHAQEAEPARDVDWSFAAQLGIGGGSSGIAGHAGLLAQRWIFDFVGLGAGLGAIGDTAIFGPSSSAQYLMPSVALRTSSHGSYAFFLVGAGLGHRTMKYDDGCIFENCTAAPNRSDTGAALAIEVGAAFHAGAFEFGPLLRADHMAGGNVITANIALGAGALRPRE